MSSVTPHVIDLQMVKSSRTPSLSPTHCELLPFSVPATSTPAIVPSASKQDQINPEEPNVNSKKNSCLENEAHYT